MTLMKKNFGWNVKAKPLPKQNYFTRSDLNPRGWVNAKKGENLTGWTNQENWNGSPWLKDR